MLTEYQNKCREMHKSGGFDMKYINEGFVDFELENYRPMFPDGSFERMIQTNSVYLKSRQFLEKSFEARDKDKRFFERDNREKFERRRAVMAHNNRCLSILSGFYADIPETDFIRRNKLRARMSEFENVINSMPEYGENRKEEPRPMQGPTKAGDINPKFNWDD